MLEPYMDNSFLYSTKELAKASLVPLRILTKAAKEANEILSYSIYSIPFAEEMKANFVLFERLTRDYEKPKFGIKKTIIGTKTYDIREEVILNKTFCNLIHFKKSSSLNLPKMLIVAPMSGHYATLCRKTVEGLLPHFDVYITSWKNARDIPLEDGLFDLDDFINYCIEFFETLAPDLHLMAVCQPAAPVTAAVSIMSSQKNPLVPKSMILVGGPIDTRKHPTEVNSFAESKSIDWFKQNVITKVPMNYKGCMREVYPGFLQLSGFISMNMGRHTNEHIKLYQNILKNDDKAVEFHTKFYDEYLAVMDLPAEFYLQTLDRIFKKHLLAKGELISRGREVRAEDIKKTAIFIIEGELDDITGIAQTKVVLDMAKNLSESKKRYSLQKGVGHFGLFSGSKFLSNIVPEIISFTKDVSK